ncbi:MAG: hypothetical protein KGJ02_02335 [Verrucomicrobiota bacterium]|nr:hypothetical protein [Verrucomicrobiota bacterium]
MMPRAAVFSHNGLGDGINMLVLSHNLHLNGFVVETYQNTMGSMQNWFPHLPVKPYPPMEELSSVLHAYDWYFVVWNDTNEFVLRLIEEGKRRFPERMKVIYIYPSPNIINEPYYSDCLIDPKLSLAQNMRNLCEKVMHFPKIARGSGLIAPEGLIFRKYPKRVIVHPTSGRESKNWPKEKFVKLAGHLKEEGFLSVFVPGMKEMAQWRDVAIQGFEVVDFPSLDELARYIYESGYLIGNDSGVGHLASALGIRTLIFCRRKAVSKLWGPSFSESIVLTPNRLIPNIRSLRLRDQYWQKFISVNKARRGFEILIQM